MALRVENVTASEDMRMQSYSDNRYDVFKNIINT